MAKNPYEVLGISENATRQEIYDAYHDLKLKYSSDRFLEGVAGAEAARNLSELEQAYNDCLEELEKKVVIEETGSVYGKITELIKAKDLNEAQKMLDNIESRDAEWHYYQSVIYYKRDWVNESKKQLDIACALEPTNKKYSDARERMNATKGDKTQNGVPNMDETRGGYTQPQSAPNNTAGACCDGCCALMCCDSCCECMGGDCISCC